MPDVIVVIPTLAGNVERLNRAIRSVRQFTVDKSLKIVVINNSNLTEIPGLEPVDEVITAGMNLGYVGALELARRKLDFEFLWCIQDDMVLLNDVLTELRAAFDRNPKLAIASPVLIRNGIVPAYSRAGVFTNQAKTQWQNVPLADTKPEELDLTLDLSFVSGSGALYSKAAIDSVGGFNLGLFPLVHVDVEICGKLVKKGYRLELVSAAHVGHETGSSTPTFLGQLLNEINTPIVQEVLSNGENRRAEESNLLDPDLVFEIAQKASYLVIELSKKAQQNIYISAEEVENLTKDSEELRQLVIKLRQSSEALEKRIAGLESSKSWKITAPLRAFYTALRSLRKR
jgi:GT2 family glycosyltransferase